MRDEEVDAVKETEEMRQERVFLEVLRLMATLKADQRRRVINAVRAFHDV
jgi:hypothetical protein